MKFIKTIATAFTIAMLTTTQSYAVVQRCTTINKKLYPITGIDISQYCGDVDFKRLMKGKTKVDFIYMRATFGMDNTDKKFETFYNDAKKENVPIGAYHFFRFREGGTAQAEHFLKTIEGKEFDLPLVLDVEEWGNSGKWNKANIIANLKAFIKTVKKHRNEDIVIYSNRNTYNKYVRDYFDDEELWICSFKELDAFSIKWQFWQYSHIGRVAGINHAVDMNTFNGNREEWENFLSYCKMQNSKENKHKKKNK